VIQVRAVAYQLRRSGVCQVWIGIIHGKYHCLAQIPRYPSTLPFKPKDEHSHSTWSGLADSVTCVWISTSADTLPYLYYYTVRTVKETALRRGSAGWGLLCLRLPSTTYFGVNVRLSMFDGLFLSSSFEQVETSLTPSLKHARPGAKLQGFGTLGKSRLMVASTDHIGIFISVGRWQSIQRGINSFLPSCILHNYPLYLSVLSPCIPSS
jgi:hypothetical protein